MAIWDFKEPNICRWLNHWEAGLVNGRKLLSVDFGTCSRSARERRTLWRTDIRELAKDCVDLAHMPVATNNDTCAGQEEAGDSSDHKESERGDGEAGVIFERSGTREKLRLGWWWRDRRYRWRERR